MVCTVWIVYHFRSNCNCIEFTLNRGSLVFRPPSTKANISKFQLDQDRGPAGKTSWEWFSFLFEYAFFFKKSVFFLRHAQQFMQFIIKEGLTKVVFKEMWNRGFYEDVPMKPGGLLNFLINLAKTVIIFFLWRWGRGGEIIKFAVVSSPWKT